MDSTSPGFAATPEEPAAPTGKAVAAPDTRRRLDLSWAITTAALAGMMAAFAIIHLRHFLKTGRPSGLAFGVMELVLVGVFIVRRRPLVASRRPFDWMVALLGGYGALLLRPAPGSLGGLDWLWAACEVVGTAGAIVCILRLGRSFGVVAANRGVKVNGPYRIVRHPMYACYLVGQIAYVLGALSWTNAAVLALAFTGQLLRIRSEERLLADDPTYRAYMTQVRFRLIPGIY